MSDDLSPVLSLPLIQPAQAQKHVTHNEALRLLDLLVQPAVESRSQTTPPPFPAPGARFVVAPGATGAWAGQEGALAVYDAEAWGFLPPLPGWMVQVLDEGQPAVWTGSAWVTPAEQDQRFPRLGVGTDADAANPLAVAGPATLLTHAGAGHQLKINKAATGETASLLFQTGWSGRAEMGTAGSDDFAIKVSPDGSSWTTALSVAAGSGLVGGAAVVSGPEDSTAGRLVTTGWMGLGVTGTPALGNANDATLSGFYRFASGTTNAPPAAGGPLLVLTGPNASNLVQIAAGTGGSDQLFFRRRNGGTWQDWSPVHTTSAFTVTSNANGLCERSPTGAQTCLRADLSTASVSVAEGQIFRSTNVTWTFPAAFAAGSKPVVQVTGEHTALIGFGIIAISPTAVTFRVKAATSIGSAVTLHAQATGRWA